MLTTQATLNTLSFEKVIATDTAQDHIVKTYCI